MSEQGFHVVGEVGTIIRCDCEVDISAASVKKIFIKRPDGTELEKDATVADTNFLQCATIAGDINGVGTYKVNPYVELPTPWEGYGKTDTFEAFNKYDTPD